MGGHSFPILAKRFVRSGKFKLIWVFFPISETANRWHWVYTLTNISSKCFASGLFAVVLKNVNSIFSYFFDFKAILRRNFRIVKKILLPQLLSRAISIFCSNSGKIADPSAGGVINKNVVKPSRMQNGSNEWCKWNFGMNENEIDLEACWLARTNHDAFDVDRKLISCDISTRCKSRKFLLCAANPV